MYRLELVTLPVPKSHRARPGARVTASDKRVAVDYLACKGDVASVALRHGISDRQVHYVLAKLGIWKRWRRVAAPPRPCEACGRPLGRNGQLHAACRRRRNAAEGRKLGNRVAKLLAQGLTWRHVEAKLGMSASRLRRLTSARPLTDAQRARRGLPPASKLAPPKKPRKKQRPPRRRWELTTIAFPPSLRGTPARRLDADERAMVDDYLACEGRVAGVLRAHRITKARLHALLERARIRKRWTPRPIERKACASCGRPMVDARRARHAACRAREIAGRGKALKARLKALLEKGWSVERVAEHAGLARSYVSSLLPGQAGYQARRHAEADAMLRRFARMVKAGSSQVDAAERLGYAPRGASNLAFRARRRGYLPR